jgi:putative heme-binding domain-containing protein
LSHPDPGVQLAAAHALGEMSSLEAGAVRGLLARLAGDMEPALEHQVMFALLQARQAGPLLESLRTAGPARSPAFQRRALQIASQSPDATLVAADVLPLFDASDPALANAAARIIAQHRDWMPALADRLAPKLAQPDLSADALSRLETAVQPWLAEKSVRDLVAALLASPVTTQQRTGWHILAASGSKAPDPRWIAPLEQALSKAAPGDVPLAIEAVASLRAPELDPALKRLTEDTQGPLSLRLKAMSALIRPGSKLSSTSCQMLLKVLQDQPSPAARFEAARILGQANLNRDQLLQLAPMISSLGPLELRQALKVIRSAPDAVVGNAFATALAKAPALCTFQESEIRTLFSNLPAECYATVAPALRELAADEDARRKKLEILPAQVASQGHAAQGRQVFSEGRGACTTCHRIGSVGNAVGPDLSTIGRIRTARDILESILFPSATIARDHEAHAIELADGQSLVAVIRRSLPDSLVVADASGQERTVPRAQIVSMQTLPISLMPMGLDRALTEPELLDLVAYLQSCK